MEITYRQGLASDVEGVLELWKNADAVRSVTDDADSVRECLRRSPGALLLASDGERIVGSVIATWDGWRGNLYKLAVLPAYRRQGIACELVRRGQAWVKEQGGIRAQALVDHDNGPSLRVFDGLGWHLHEGMARITKTLRS